MDRTAALRQCRAESRIQGSRSVYVELYQLSSSFLPGSDCKRASQTQRTSTPNRTSPPKGQKWRTISRRYAQAIERHNLRGDIDRMRPEQLDSDEGFWVLVGRASSVDTPLCLLMKYRQTQSYSAEAPSYGDLSRWLGSRGILARVVRLAGGRNLAEVQKVLCSPHGQICPVSLSTQNNHFSSSKTLPSTIRHPFLVRRLL
jgi:hypothetical protein